MQNILDFNFVFLYFSKSPSELLGRRIGMFSYGSGLMSAMFSLKVTDKESSKLTNLLQCLSDIPAKLEARQEILPADFVEILAIHEKTHHLNNYTPVEKKFSAFCKSFT